MVLFIVVFCLLVAMGFGVAAGLSDLRGMIIPNSYCVGIMLAFVPAYAAFMMLAPETHYFQSWASHVIAFALVFAGSFILFAVKMFGAGDSKLASALALWIGMEGLSAYIFYMALAGGLLGIVTIILRNRVVFASAKPPSWVGRVQQGDNVVPYGIAIAAGAFAGFIWLGYLSPEKLLVLAAG